MPTKRYERQVIADTKMRVAIVQSCFYEAIGKSLIEGALAALTSHGVPEENIVVASVPGAFEIPLITQELAKSGKYGAVVCLGAVIRGETTHYDYVAGQMSAGIARVSLETGVPIGFGVLTTETIEQAEQRADPSAGNKGGDAALAALEMACLIRAIHRD
jgi:6,7-dimethyl-8-ribityllumazine synthase